MKNISLGLNVVLIIAVAILYFLHFSENKPFKTENKVETEPIKSEKPVVEVEKIASKIGYLNTDSLRKNYKLYDELITKLKGRQKKYDAELNTKSAAFEKKVMAFRQKAPTMTQFEGETKQKELAKEEEALYKMQDDFAVKFQNEQIKLDDKFQKTVNDFIKNYNKNINYNLIIGASKAGNVVLDYNEGINITNQIVDGLNKQYELEKTPKEQK